MSSLHYGPWEVTFTDGDTALPLHVHARDESEAIGKAYDEGVATIRKFDSPVRAIARRL